MFKYPWGNLQGLNLAWFLEKFNQLLEDWATAEAGIDGALDDEIQKAEDALSDVFDARDAAAASATAAAGSASAAGTSATAAQNSATGAANSATIANNKATAAGLSEAAAAQSATQAGNSATAAAGSATTAGTAATNAAASETAAGNSETAAAASATAAATSETNAAASAAQAENVLESIPSDYSVLSQEVANHDTLLTALAYPEMIKPFCFEKAGKSATVADRYFEVYKNRFRIVGTSANAQYYGTFISGRGQIQNVPGSFDAIVAAVTNDDFIQIPAPLTANAKIILTATATQVPGNNSSVPGSGEIVLVSKNANDAVSGQGFSFTSLPFALDISQNFSQAITNGNIAIGYRNYRVDANTDITMIFELKIIVPSLYQ